ncbi:hypothetical protein [Halobacteriovorax sp. ZH5_bin.2]|uniref:hypothetical protein n=1 Tax=Halobacteriovorax sp. ZH5_bin.2 TaxID=3157727 RepID=UPI00371CA756
MIDIDEQFRAVIADLQAGKRPNCTYTKEDFSLFKARFEELNREENWEALIPLLCLLDNTITLDHIIYPEIMNCLALCHDPEVLTLCLGVARKQIIDEFHKRGERLPFEFLETLEKLVGHQNPEVFEWALRLIESLGSQSIYFKKAVLEAKPGFFARFNQHKKACVEIIELLEHRWQ